MSYTEKDYNWFKEHELKRDDTFQFECSMCGNCCRNRLEPILITGADLFRISKSLGKPMADVMKENMAWNIGDVTHIPVLTLRERMDGSCKLLRSGKCSVHKDKPAVCAMFPLGRFYDMRDNSFHYFTNRYFCKNGSKTGKVWTLQEWLDEFNLEESTEMTAAWNKLMTGICDVTYKMNINKINGDLLSLLFYVLYLNYDIENSFIPQVEANMILTQELFKSKFHKDIKF